tara:strand:+ start:1467 stop:1679 length:213 start_codon:yes stop_codon:yes gene_type:complete
MSSINHKLLQPHHEILKHYGLEIITSNNNDWANSPNVYVLVAELITTGEMIGGARIHIASNELGYINHIF